MQLGRHLLLLRNNGGQIRNRLVVKMLTYNLSNLKRAGCHAEALEACGRASALTLRRGSEWHPCFIRLSPSLPYIPTATPTNTLRTCTLHNSRWCTVPRLNLVAPHCTGIWCKSLPYIRCRFRNGRRIWFRVWCFGSWLIVNGSYPFQSKQR